MNSIERVKAALNFNVPDKVPIWKAFGKSDVFMMARIPSMKWQPGHYENEKGLFPHLADDIIYKSKLWIWDRPEWAKDPKYRRWIKIFPREEIDEFGTIWKRGGIDTMGHPGSPTLLDYKDLDDYIQKYTPILDDKKSYEVFIKMSKSIGKEKYRMAYLELGPFQMASQMRGFNTFLIDHRKHKEEVKRLLAHTTEQYIKMEKMYIKFGLDPHGFALFDDLGEQHGPFFSPKTFKEFYEPVYRPLFETAHELGCEFHLHCCGKIDHIMPLLIEWGLDAIELDSPRMTGYPDLKQFRGKLMMWGCINIQSVYTQGTPEECEREVWHMVRNLGTSKGGFGAYFYPQDYHIKAPKENVHSFEEGLKKYGDYSKIPAHWWEHPTVEEWEDNVVPSLPPS